MAIIEANNISHELDKKDPNYRRQVRFNYKIKEISKSVIINPMEQVYIFSQTVPHDLMALKSKGVISYRTISESEYLALLGVNERKKSASERNSKARATKKSQSQKQKAKYTPKSKDEPKGDNGDGSEE